MNGRCPEENKHGSFLLLLLEWCNLGDKDDSELSLHHEFNPSSTKIGHVRAKTLLDYIKSINNPFDAGIRLQNISTGADIPQEVVDGLLECLEIGEKSYEEFVKTRFQNKEKHLHDTIPTNRKTVFVKRISTPSTAKKSMAKKDAAETIRYINYARERGYSMLELLKYELTSTSQFLTTECKDGIKLKKPDKASLARELVSHLPQETRNVKSDAQMTIVDFMALVRKLPMKKMGLHTFEELAKSLSDRILATGSVSTRIDIIFYVYQKSSIKQMERAQRSSSEEITITIRSDNQKLPVNLDMFWSSMLNKVRLQEKLLAGNETQIAELSSNQEEADDRIMFHINDGVVKHGVQSVLVDSPDTDVFVNLIFHFNTTWQLQKLYVKLGNQKTKKTVPVHLLVDQLDNGLVSCLPAIHALSGCDSTKLSPQITSNAEKFLVSGLKKTDCSTFDEYRWEQYHNSKKELDFNQLVCCSSTIREHIKRAYLQCKMWLQAPTPVVTKPDPLQYGYEATDVGTTPVILPEASESAKQPCICRRLVSVEGMMNSDKYKAVLQTHLLPTMRRDFPDGDGIFQQDLAPCHTSCKMRTFFEESGLEVLDWPGNSPDINPIKNLWVIMKRRLQKEDCSTMTKLISAGIRAWYHDEELAKMCSNLVESMPNRVQMLVKAKGGCDTVSYLFGHSKKAAWEVFLTDNTLLSCLGIGELTPRVLKDAETFICKVYSVHRITSCDKARVTLFCKCKSQESLPPTSDAVTYHIQRAHYQSMIWRQATSQQPHLPSATTLGWELTDEKLRPKLMSLPPIPVACKDIIRCGCKTGSSSGRCSCRAGKLKCTGACACANSGNVCMNK
ncbi:Transposable element Tc1 transposase [Nymphon striatum]|nr:Transposable element Tc1 transposase [Nymphon striatum]